MTMPPTNTPATGETKKLQELMETLRDAVNFKHDGGEDGYQQSADTMWKAPLAAFNWAASEVGASGFQASWAALRFYAEAMHIENPFMIVRLDEALYPQYDLPGQVTRWLEENKAWLAEEAKKKLDEYESRPTVEFTDSDGATRVASSAHPNVVAHWRKLVEAPESAP